MFWLCALMAHGVGLAWAQSDVCIANSVCKDSFYIIIDGIRVINLIAFMYIILDRAILANDRAKLFRESFFVQSCLRTVPLNVKVQVASR